VDARGLLKIIYFFKEFAATADNNSRQLSPRLKSAPEGHGKLEFPLPKGYDSKVETYENS
jgi:hypothetical protein